VGGGGFFPAQLQGPTKAVWFCFTAARAVKGEKKKPRQKGGPSVAGAGGGDLGTGEKPATEERPGLSMGGTRGGWGKPGAANGGLPFLSDGFVPPGPFRGSRKRPSMSQGGGGRRVGPAGAQGFLTFMGFFVFSGYRGAQTTKGGRGDGGNRRSSSMDDGTNGLTEGRQGPGQAGAGAVAAA